MLKYIPIFLVFCIYTSKSTPDLAQWTSNKCSKCHVNSQGGGLRKDFGWKFSRDASIYPIGNDKIKKIYNLFDKERYAFDLTLNPNNFDSIKFVNGFAFGFDFRFQSFRSHKTETAVRKYFPMEANTYIAFKPTQWLTLNTEYNLGRIVFQGQDNWMASLILDFQNVIPSIRVGKFQPSFGIKDCDMTCFDRRIANLDATSSLFPPSYSEFGFELFYNQNDKFDVNIGAFDSRFLSEVTVFGNIPIIVKHNPTFTLKVVLFDILPLIGDITFISNYFLGSSLFLNGKFNYTSTFIGLTFFDDLLFYCEYATSNIQNTRATRNLIFKLGYVITRGVVIYSRFELGNSILHTTPETIWEISNKQALGGIKLFPIPYLEISAEYRYLQTLENKSLRWAFQIHFFY
ncbi:MAG: hypothetical protein ACUVQ1_06275 [Candidatus Kapaibacteriales bacterium]